MLYFPYADNLNITQSSSYIRHQKDLISVSKNMKLCIYLVILLEHLENIQKPNLKKIIHPDIFLPWLIGSLSIHLSQFVKKVKILRKISWSLPLLPQDFSIYFSIRQRFFKTSSRNFCNTIAYFNAHFWNGCCKLCNCLFFINR